MNHIKEKIFYRLSEYMDEKEATKNTDEIFNEISSFYNQSKLQPINGNDTYRYFFDNLVEKGWDMYYQHRIDKYINGKWERFMEFKGITERSKCVELVERLRLGGNTMIKY